MARPDTEDGWFRLAYELLPVLLFGNFRVEASIVICEVLAQTYGRGKRAAARIEPAKIAARSGRKRENIWRGVRELVEAGVIEKTPAGDYLFRKNYAKWRSNQSPLIDTHLQQYCAAYPSLARSFDPDVGNTPSVSSVDTVSTEANGLSVSSVDTVSENPDGLSVSSVDTPTVSEVDTLSALPPKNPPSVCENGECALSPEGACAPVRDPAPNIRTPEDLAEVHAAIDLLSRDLNLEGFGQKIGQMHNTAANIGLAGWRWYVAAYLLSQGKIKKTWDYFMGVVKRATQDEYDDARDAMDPRSHAPLQVTRPARRNVHAERNRRQNESIDSLDIPEDED